MLFGTLALSLRCIRLDAAKLANLGEHVYPGGGKKNVEMVRGARPGERLEL